MLLALDTVFPHCSVSLFDGKQLLASSTVAGNRGQTELILPMLDELLRRTAVGWGDICALGFNCGPGAFSGIRINTAVVQALSFAHELPCVPISSLHSLAAFAVRTNNISEGSTITAVIDARQHEVYACQYRWQAGKLHKLQEEQLLAYGAVIDSDYVIGDGATLVSGARMSLAGVPTSEDIAYLAYPRYIAQEGVSADKALPVYLRHNAWKTLAEQQAARQQGR